MPKESAGYVYLTGCGTVSGRRRHLLLLAEAPKAMCQKPISSRFQSVLRILDVVDIVHLHDHFRLVLVNERKMHKHPDQCACRPSSPKSASRGHVQLRWNRFYEARFLLSTSARMCWRTQNQIGLNTIKRRLLQRNSACAKRSTNGV